MLWSRFSTSAPERNRLSWTRRPPLGPPSLWCPSPTPAAVVLGFSLTVWESAARPSQKNARTPAGKAVLVGMSRPPLPRGAVTQNLFSFLSFIWFLTSSAGVLLGPEYRTESLRAESISSSPSPVLSTTPMAAGHSKTDSRDSYTQTDKGRENQESSKASVPALQSMTLPARLSSTSPVYIPDRLAGRPTSPFHSPFWSTSLLLLTFSIVHF